jgi:hypothetical protein
MNALEQAPGDVLPIGDQRAHSFWVEQKMQHVLRTRARSHIDEAIEKTWRTFVHHEHVPVAVHHHCRKRLLLAQNAL